jgi:hypothetical protein
MAGVGALMHVSAAGHYSRHDFSPLLEEQNTSFKLSRKSDLNSTMSTANVTYFWHPWSYKTPLQATQRLF